MANSALLTYTNHLTNTGNPSKSHNQAGEGLWYLVLVQEIHDVGEGYEWGIDEEIGGLASRFDEQWTTRRGSE